MKKLHISMAGKRAVNGYLFILPWLLGFLLFYVRSLYMTVEFSLSDLTVLSTGGYNLEFVGLKNYYEAFFSHASFKQTLTTSIGNMVIDVPLIIFFSLFVAMMLNRKMKCRGLVRAIFFLPVLLGAEAVSNALSLAAQMMAGGLSGTSADMAAASASSGTMNMDYLIDLFAQLALPDVVLDYIVGAVSRISDIIQASGVQIVLFIAGLQSIPSSLYEVAKIDTARRSPRAGTGCPPRSAWFRRSSPAPCWEPWCTSSASAPSTTIKAKESEKQWKNGAHFAILPAMRMPRAAWSKKARTC